MFIFSPKIAVSSSGPKWPWTVSPTGSPTSLTGQSGPPSKLVPNVLVGPKGNGPFHLIYIRKVYLVPYINHTGLIVEPAVASAT